MLAKRVIAAVTLLALIGVATAREEPPEPEEALVDMVETLLETVDASRAKFDENPQAVYESVRSILESVVDFESMAQVVMSRHGREADAEQRARFVDLLTSGMVRPLTDALMASELEVEQIRTVSAASASENERRRSVTMEVRLEDDSEVSMSYTMARDEHERWWVRNVMFEGLNLGIIYRSQFASAVQNSGNDIEQAINDWPEFMGQPQLAAD